MRILEKLQSVRVVRAETLEELKAHFDMVEVCNTQFGKALRSLCYNKEYRVIRIIRPYSSGHYYRPRTYVVRYVSESALEGALAVMKAEVRAEQKSASVATA